VRLAPGDLAVARPDLADLRVVDASSRQWSYLLDRGTDMARVPLQERPCTGKGGTTCHALKLPASPRPISALVLDCETAYFDRPFELRGRLEDGREVSIARGRLRRAADSSAPVEVQVQEARVSEPRMLVEDGDDAPLAFTSLVAKVRVPHVLLAAPAGSYALLLGHPDAAAPRYDVERVRALVLGVEAEEARVGSLERNEQFRATARLTQGRGPTRALVWAAIVLAVVVLGAFTLRLARRETTGSAE
jgi:hypothetical protein